MRRRGHRGGQGGDEKARLHEALAQRRRHRRQCRAPAKRRARTAFASSTRFWACASTCARASPSSPTRWAASPARAVLPGGAAHGLAGVRGGEHPHHRHGRRRLRARMCMEMMLAGATAVEVGAANLVNPYACRDIIARPARGDGELRHRTILTTL